MGQGTPMGEVNPDRVCHAVAGNARMFAHGGEVIRFFAMRLRHITIASQPPLTLIPDGNDVAIGWSGNSNSVQMESNRRRGTDWNIVDIVQHERNVVLLSFAVEDGEMNINKTENM